MDQDSTGTEKASVRLAEDVAQAPMSNDATVPESAGLDEVAVKRLIRKIDLKLLPLLTALYLLSFLDRTNIGNARLDTLEVDLGMSGLMYNNALAIFFPFYVMAEIPSNIAMKRFPPWLWIPFIMLVWGICCTLMGIVQNYEGLLAARAVLGLSEGGLFPGIAYYITMWYRRHECGLRLAIFFSAATLAGAFGGLLARGVLEMRNVAGLAGWRWLFIIEGILTVVMALVAVKVMQDYPEKAKFLSDQERSVVLTRLEHDRSSLSNDFDLKYVVHALTDWKIWVHVVVTICVYTGVYSYSLFLPTIIRDLGYANATAQLMSVPPFLLACILCVTAGWYADKLRQRGVFMLAFLFTAMIGFIMLLATQNSAVKYVGCFLAAAGIYPSVPQGVAWNSNNIGGGLKRGVGIAMHVGFGNISGIISSYLFLKKDSPRYYPGIGTLVGLYTLAFTLCAVMTLYLRRENARRDREFAPPDQYTDEQRNLEKEMGDNATFFRYTI
ncbi:major facilitator superfamily domain-containing protein [Dactylonectria estremocensis]|uniref:Major facilitator superfamily domain-containing protein n=1 Tax=Dactylonectria estremocensis TaxID=1079267 RepID=A0A9P9DNM0_9HYPO|nr:major facilitator superfamily domain-containing protein [Dactylonectria estremocensis]